MFPYTGVSLLGSLGELEDDSEIIKDLVANGVKRIHYRKELKLIDELGSVEWLRYCNEVSNHIMIDSISQTREFGPIVSCTGTEHSM